MKKKIRSFIAIPLAPGVRSNAVKLIRKLSESDDGIKWVPTDNLHLTLKFLGDVENTDVPDICNALTKIGNQFDPFVLNFRGTGGFPSIDSPRILYAGIEDPTGSLVAMAEQIEDAMADLRFKREPRDYRPHLTLGRTRSRSRAAQSDTVERLKEHEDLVFGEMEVDEVELIASFMDKGGPTYQVMGTVEL